MSPHLRWHFPLTSNSLSPPHTHLKKWADIIFILSHSHSHNPLSHEIIFFLTLVCFVLIVTFVCFVFWRYKNSIFLLLDKQTIPSVLFNSLFSLTLSPIQTHIIRTYLHTHTAIKKNFLIFYCFVLAVFFLLFLLFDYFFLVRNGQILAPTFLNNNSSEKKE